MLKGPKVVTNLTTESQRNQKRSLGEGQGQSRLINTADDDHVAETVGHGLGHTQDIGQDQEVIHFLPFFFCSMFLLYF